MFTDKANPAIYITVAESQYWSARTTQENKETEARTFNLKVANDKTRATVRGIRGQSQSRVLFPGDTDSNTVQPVMEILIDKHTTMRTPDLADLECSSFEEYEKDPDVVPLNILEEDVMWVPEIFNGQPVRARRTRRCFKTGSSTSVNHQKA